MKIGIDISQIIYETGVSWYTSKLIENLLRIDTENEYLFYGGSLRRISDLKNKTNHLKGNFKTKFFPIPPTLSDFLWNRLHVLNIETLTGKLDVFHSSDWTQPPSNAFKVTTIHDLWPIKFPEQNHPKIVAAHKARLEWVKREVDRIIVPSLATKNDLIDLAFEKEKITIIPEGPHIDKVNNNINYDIKGDFLLGVGVSERKNTSNIIKAFKLLNRPDLSLVLVGIPHIQILKEENIKVLGQVDDITLSSLFSHAQALVYPSLNEGFGLPILDAFNSGCPVVTSNVSSMPEVADDAAKLVDPQNPEDIAQGIKEVLKDREKYIRSGFARAKEYTWTKAAQQTLDVYRSF